MTKVADTNSAVTVYCGEALARYHFGETHPFGPHRHDAFMHALQQQGLDKRVKLAAPTQATQAQIELFHTHEYVEWIKAASKQGTGYLDGGDTPAILGIYEAATTIVGTVLHAIDAIMAAKTQRAFVPIAGLHHARRRAAAGFCVFNDCGVAIEYLRKHYKLERIAYVDIDAHHGDGVFYGFENDAHVYIVDIHEDGRYLYPGTGGIEETGTGEAKGTKLNIPMPMNADDALFKKVWASAEIFLQKAQPEFILLQCGADSLAGDPITDMAYSAETHGYAAQHLCALAKTTAQGRLLAVGGGGYNLENLAQAWCKVVEALVSC